MARVRRTGKPGRPSKLVPETVRKIIEAISAGSHISAACRYAGINESTYREWLEKGRAAASGIHREFADAVDQADARAEVRVVAEWNKHMPKEWMACRDFLARRYPERWAEVQKVNILVEKEVEAMLEDLRGKLPPEVYRQVLEGLAAGGGGEAPAGPPGRRKG